jgi:selenoprotein W-related protein
LAAAILRERGVEAQLTPGANGIFDVVVDGKKVFSKHETGRFPQNDEIVSLLGSG